MEKKKLEAAMEAEQTAAEREETATGETWGDTEAAGAAREAANAAEEDGEEVELLVKFRRPYTFEGRTYTEIDLHGLEDATAAQLENVGRQLLKKRPGLNPSTLEMTMEYANMLAAKVTGKPMEFFDRLPAKEAMKVKTAVVGFLYGGDGED